MSYYLSEKFIKIAKGLMETYKAYYDSVKPKVEFIIDNNITDRFYIEHTFDDLLNIPTDEGYELLVTLYNYVSSFDRNLAEDYLKAYNEMYGDESPSKGLTK